MSGSSVGAMVVGTVFIMVFGMATVSLIDNVNQSIKNSDFELANPKVDLISVTANASILVENLIVETVNSLPGINSSINIHI